MIDIAVGAAVGVMSGVMFWVFDGLSYGLFPLLTLILPGSAALLHALFYFPATLGLLIVRKPGASAYVLLVASFVEVVLGTKYSVSLVVIALVQALAAEAVFAVFRYRRWTLGVTLLSAVAIGIVYNFYLLFFYYQAFSFFSPRGLIGMACELLSAVVFAGFGSWVLYRALAKSGVLTRFASGRWRMLGGIYFDWSACRNVNQARSCCSLTGSKSHASSPTFTLSGSVPSGMP